MGLDPDVWFSNVELAAGKLIGLEKVLASHPARGRYGIGHTRWATHGKPSETNAHPHLVDGVAVVHNGILENYAALRAELLAAGVELSSDTDTELIAQLIGREHGSLDQRVLAIRPRLVGQYAVVAVSRNDPDLIVAFGVLAAVWPP